MGAFTGKTVLILGGSRGIGAAIVRRFVTDGANVRFTYAGSKDAAEHLAQETGATAVFTDSADRDAVIDVVRKSGALDILVVNAGIGVFGDALELNADDIDRLFKINIHAPYHASVEAARQMPEGGRILIIGSVNGDRMPVAGMAAYAASKSALQGMAAYAASKSALQGMAAYAASKSALQGMARGLARDFGPRGITINVVQPGPIDTDANPANGPMRDMLHSFMAIKRHEQPEEVAGMVAWLAGPEASFVTGAMHTIDGAFGA
ncbi:SDR family oxidoreductase [Escherichia coli]